MTKDKNSLASLLFFATGIVLCLLFYQKPVHDYGNYYYGSKFALQGVPVRDIYEPYKFNLLIRELPDIQHESFFENYAVVPPFTLLFYVPFTFFDVHVSKFLFNLASVFFFSFFLLKLLRHLQIQSDWVFTLPLLLIIPFRNNILFGQTYLLATGFMVAGFLSGEKKKNISAAVFYALAIVLKISPAIALLFLVTRKNYRLAGMTLIFSVLLFLSPVFYTGTALMKQYLIDYIPRMAMNEINNPYATTYQSITVLLRNVFIPDQLLNPGAAFNSVLLFRLLGGLCTGILFFFAVRQLQKSKDNFSAFSFAMMAGLLFTAYTSSYSLVFLLPVCVEALRKQHFTRLIMLSLALLACTVPVSLFQSLPVILRFPRLYFLLILFFACCHKHLTLHKDAAALALCLVIFISGAMLFSKSSRDGSEYFLDKEVSLLSYDFEFKGKNLVLKTLQDSGPQEKIIGLRDPVFAVQNISIINDQFDFPEQFTTVGDHKLKAVLINHNEIVYLSDKNRGIGFYALRRIRFTGQEE